MRTFIALELPRRIKKDLERIQKDLRSVGVQARWVKPEIAHLTLVFLGSITRAAGRASGDARPDKVEVIGKILEEVCCQIKPVKLKLHQVGCFPSPAKARIIFVNLQGELGKLNALAIKIKKRLKKAAIQFDEKPFAAHITLGRIKNHSGLGQNLTEITKKIKIKRLEFIANEVSLIKSTLAESGPIYQTIKTVKLCEMNFANTD